MSIRFAHRRVIDQETGEISPRGGLTFAYEQVGNEIHYAIARCHTNDNFNKQQGRVKAAGRMMSDKHRQSTTLGLTEFKERMYNMPLSYVGLV